MPILHVKKKSGEEKLVTARMKIYIMSILPALRSDGRSQIQDASGKTLTLNKRDSIKLFPPPKKLIEKFNHCGRTDHKHESSIMCPQNPNNASSSTRSEHTRALGTTNNLNDVEPEDSEEDES